MKKVISILLVLVLAITLTAPVFATGDVLIAGESQKLTLKKDTKDIRTFTSAENGVYLYSCDIVVDECVSTAGFILYTYAYEGDELIDTFGCTKLMVSSDFDFVTAASEYFYAKAGVTYTIKTEVMFLSDTDNTANTVVAKVAITPYDAKEVKIGGTYTCTVDSPAFIIRPTQDTTYNITADIYDYFTVKDYNINIAYAGLNPDKKINATFELEGGKEYLLIFEQNAETDFSFKVNDGTTVLPESVEISWGLEMPVGSSQALAYSIYPIGSEINSKGIEVTIGDGRIASVEYVENDSNGYSYYLVHGLKKGKTTITVTEKSTGLSATEEVRVVSQLYYNMANSSSPIIRVFARFIAIIENLFNR